jgi:hypothetical protein
VSTTQFRERFNVTIFSIAATKTIHLQLDVWGKFVKSLYLPVKDEKGTAVKRVSLRYDDSPNKTNTFLFSKGMYIEDTVHLMQWKDVPNDTHFPALRTTAPQVSYYNRLLCTFHLSR